MTSGKNIFCLGGHENTLALSRYASGLGIKTIYFDFDKTETSFSRRILFKKLGKMSEDEILSYLLEVKENLGGNKPFIFFNSDYFVRFANNHRSVLTDEFNFIIPDSKIIECALDKGRMDEILPVKLLPIRFPVKTTDQLLCLSPPLIVKPRDTSKETPFKTRILKSLTEFSNFANIYNGQFGNFLFQEVINEPGGRLISIFFYINPEGRFYSVAIERERMNPHWGGVGCLIKATKCEFAEQIEKVLRQMDYVGLGEIDVYESRGKITIFDLNVRLPGWAFFAKKCGADLMGMYLMDLSKGTLALTQRAVSNSDRSIKAIDLINDMEVVFHPRKGLLFNGKLTVGQYLKSLRGVRSFFIFNLFDFRPFFYKMMMELLNPMFTTLKV